MKYEKGTVITLPYPHQASNTFIVDTDEGETVLVGHPMSPFALFRFPKIQINKVNANIKDSTERSLDYAKEHAHHLDYTLLSELEAMGMFFAFRRRLTPKQKQTLANICGILANIKFNGNITETMNFVTENSNVLDDFNKMWFTQFKDLFSGKQAITSLKQRNAILNIAGHVLAELENPTTSHK